MLQAVGEKLFPLKSPIVTNGTTQSGYSWSTSPTVSGGVATWSSLSGGGAKVSLTSISNEGKYSKLCFYAYKSVASSFASISAVGYNASPYEAVTTSNAYYEIDISSIATLNITITVYNATTNFYLTNMWLE